MEQELVSRVARILHVESSLLEQALAEKDRYKIRRRKKPEKDAAGQPRFRILHVPPESVKKVQRAIHEWLLEVSRWQFSKSVLFTWPLTMHGYLPRRSHVTAAREHVGAKTLLTLDFQDAFPSVKRSRVLKALELHAKMGRGEADFVARLATYHGRLRQGSPSSPLLFNLVLLDFVGEIERFAREREYRVTIYADEVAVSSEKPIPIEDRRAILGLVTRFGFAVHPKKIRYQESRWGELELTKVLVHSNGIGLSTRRTVDGVRAFIDRLAKRGSASEKELLQARGHLAWVGLVDPEKLRTRLKKSRMQLFQLEHSRTGSS